MGPVQRTVQGGGGLFGFYPPAADESLSAERALLQVSLVRTTLGELGSCNGGARRRAKPGVTGCFFMPTEMLLTVFDTVRCTAASEFQEARSKQKPAPRSLHAVRAGSRPGTTLRPHHFDGLRRARVSSSCPSPWVLGRCMALSFLLRLGRVALSSCNQHSDILRTTATSSEYVGMQSRAGKWCRFDPCSHWFLRFYPSMMRDIVRSTKQILSFSQIIRRSACFRHIAFIMYQNIIYI